MGSLEQLGAVAVAQQSQVTEGYRDIFSGVLDRLAGEITSAGLPLNSSSPKLEAFRVVKQGAGTLFGFTVFNSNVAAQFIQLHDTNTSPPANGTAPVFVISVPTITSQGIAWVIPGRFFTRGILIVNSSTVATLTIGAADCFFDAQYI